VRKSALPLWITTEDSSPCCIEKSAYLTIPSIRSFRAWLTRTETAPKQIASVYVRQIGLDLSDIHEAFAEGKWQSFSGKYPFGGPRWKAIAGATIRLGATIENADWSDAPSLLTEIKAL
jgi:hypothetical protein